MAAEVLVLLSGGLDSAVLLAWVKAQGRTPVVLDFDFPARLNAERRAAESLARSAGIERIHRVSLPFVETPNEAFSNYIPRRNLMFYGIAASMAEQWSLPEIYGGHIRSDADSFPDARPEYFESLNTLIAAASLRSGNHRCRIITPFVSMDKPQIVRMGNDLGVPFELTWSCLRDGDAHCRECSSCRERHSGFHGAGVTDPLERD
ncbi:MAG: 7-cyano-7-deazaguanine synthase [Nitrospirae bacterium]|nr:7-cyano-7-deazaguanine synthase [Nitrospirota bacterium]